MEDDRHHLIKIKLNEMYKCIQISSINTLYLQTRMNIEILNIESFCEDDTAAAARTSFPLMVKNQAPSDVLVLISIQI